MAVEVGNRAKTCTVSGPLSYVLRVSQVLGMAPLSFTKIGSGWRVRVSPKLNIYSKIFVTALCSIFTILMALIGKQAVSGIIKSVKDDIADKVFYFSNTSMTVIFVLYSSFLGHRRMKTIIACLSSVEELHNKLSIDYPQTHLKKIQWKLALFTLVLGFAMSFSNVVEIAVIEYTSDFGYILIGQQFLTTVLFIIRLTTVTQFVLVVQNIVLAFKRLNDCLKHLETNMNERNGVKHNYQHLPGEIRQLVSYHGSLCDMAKHVDEIHGFQLFIFLSINLLSLITTMYFIILSIVVTEVNFELQKVLIYFVWFVVHLIHLLAVIEPCHDTFEEVEVTKIIVTKMMWISVMKDENVYKAVDKFYKHLSLVNVSYSPMNIFTLNRSLLVTIFSAITTYLVIVLQNRQ